MNKPDIKTASDSELRTYAQWQRAQRVQPVSQPQTAQEVAADYIGKRAAAAMFAKKSR